MKSQILGGFLIEYSLGRLLGQGPGAERWVAGERFEGATVF